MIKFATPEGTQHYSNVYRQKGFPPSAFRTLGRTHLTCSAIGFGTYRVDEEHSEHINSLDRALASGCNLIDTSTNYTDGNSERCIGAVLKAGISRSAIKREEIILVSKVGYVQGENLEIALEQESTGKGYPEMVKYADGCWHCIHPVFIRQQLERSLKRTGLRGIDVYLLHNPEYFFMDALQRTSRLNIAELRHNFYRRIRTAFQCLEECVTEGLIHSYGVSSNTFGHPTGDPDHVSVVELWKIAEELAITNKKPVDAHHFSVIQLPLNLFETGPAFEINAQSASTLSFAANKNLGVLVNRPLNAFLANRLVRLADFPELITKFPLEELLKMTAILEEEFLVQFAKHIQVDPDSLQPEAYFRWAEELRRVDLTTLAVEQWDQYASDALLPQIHHLTQELDHFFSASENKMWQAWRNGYLGTIEELVKAVHNVCAEKGRKASEEISGALARHLDDTWKSESLSRKAIGTIAALPEISCVLNGMRRVEYVEDSLGVLKLPKIKNSVEILTSLRQHA